MAFNMVAGPGIPLALLAPPEMPPPGLAARDMPDANGPAEIFGGYTGQPPPWNMPAAFGG